MKKFDTLSEKELKSLTRLKHPHREDDMFDENGFVVICEDCFTKAIEEDE